MALNRCEQMESRWNRCAVSRESQEMAVMRRPSSVRNSRPVRLTGPSDSIATGTKSLVAGRLEYLPRFLSAACSAACASRRYRRQVDIGGRAQVNGCCVPSNILAPRPRNESSSVRSFAVVSDEAWWFLRAWDVRFRQGSTDNIEGT